MEVEGTEGIDFKICDHCRHRIPISVIENHTLSCMRRNWFCEICQDVFEKSRKEEHIQNFHSKILCNECGQEMEARLLENHTKNECPRRIVQCQYCPLQMPYNEKFEHEKKCGTQTINCEKCHKYVQKKGN